MTQPALAGFFSTHTPVANPVQQANKEENKLTQAKSFVDSWFSLLKIISYTTLFFCIFSVLFATLDVYDSDGNVVKNKIEFEAAQFLFTPAIIPVLFILFASAEQFSITQKNQRKNLTGRYSNKDNKGRDIVKKVFDGLVFPSVVTLAVYVCYATSFSLFFSYAGPRCASESLDKNDSLIYLLHKFACMIYNFPFTQLLLSILIAGQTIVLGYYFFKSMPLASRTNAGKFANNTRKGAGRRALALKDTTGRGVSRGVSALGEKAKPGFLSLFGGSKKNVNKSKKVPQNKVIPRNVQPKTSSWTPARRRQSTLSLASPWAGSKS